MTHSPGDLFSWLWAEAERNQKRNWRPMWATLANLVLALHVATMVLLAIAPHISLVLTGILVGLFSAGQLATRPFCPLTLLELWLRSRASPVYWQQRHSYRVLGLALARSTGLIASVPAESLVKRWKTIFTVGAASSIAASWTYAFAVMLLKAQ